MFTTTTTPSTTTNPTTTTTPTLPALPIAQPPAIGDQVEILVGGHSGEGATITNIFPPLFIDLPDGRVIAWRPETTYAVTLNTGMPHGTYRIDQLRLLARKEGAIA